MEKKITLVVVDFQYDFCLLGAPLYVPRSDRALWNISHLIENKKIGEVIFTADWHPANGLGIYSTEIDENLNFKGIAGTADNFYQIVNGQFGTIVASNPFTGVLKVNNDGGYTIQDEGVYLKGELLGDPLDFLNVEQPKSYFY